MWSESTFVPNEWPQPGPFLAYIVGAAVGYWEKEGAGRAIFFPSSQGLQVTDRGVMLWLGIHQDADSAGKPE